MKKIIIFIIIIFSLFFNNIQAKEEKNTINSTSNIEINLKDKKDKLFKDINKENIKENTLIFILCRKDTKNCISESFPLTENNKYNIEKRYLTTHRFRFINSKANKNIFYFSRLKHNKTEEQILFKNKEYGITLDTLAINEDKSLFNIFYNVAITKETTYIEKYINAKKIKVPLNHNIVVVVEKKELKKNIINYLEDKESSALIFYKE